MNPADSASLVEEIRRRGGRVFRAIDGKSVFCLTTNGDLMRDLAELGARAWGSYKRTSDAEVLEHDISLTPLTWKPELDEGNTHYNASPFADLWEVVGRMALEAAA